MITRRTLVQAATSGALAAPFIRPSYGADRTITLLTYSGIYQDSFQETVIDPFMRTHPGIKVSYYGVPSSAQMLGLLRVQKAAPQTDVTIFELTFSKTATDEAIIEPLTRQSMPVMAELDDTAFVPGVGGATIAYDSLALLYAPQAVTPAPTSWKALWDKKYTGRITIPGLPDLTGACMVIIANYMAGADYRQSTQKGFEAMGDMAPLVLSWEPKPDSYSFVVNGMAELGVGWNARAQLFAKQSPERITATMPTEGSLVYHNTINLTRNAPRPTPPSSSSPTPLAPRPRRPSPNACSTPPPTPRSCSTPKPCNACPPSARLAAPSCSRSTGSRSPGCATA